MYITDIMTYDPVTIRQQDSLKTALDLMAAHNCRHLPVVSKDGHVVGIISDRDCRLALNSPHLMRERWLDDEVTLKTPIAAVMTPAPIVVEPDAHVREATRLMLSNNISALPVMRAETLVGIVTTSDVLVAFMRMTDPKKTTMM